MDLFTAALLLAVSVLGLAASALLLKKQRRLRIALIVLFALLAVALAGYLGLAALLLDAARNRPPDM